MRFLRISDLLSMCARNLTRRKFRTLLTVMGVVIGTSFIVMMISLGIGMEQAQMQMMEAFGDLNVITVQNFGNTATPMDENALARISAIPGVEIVTPIVEQIQGEFDNAQLVMSAGRRGRYQWFAWGIAAMDPQGMEAFGFVPAQGEGLYPASPRQGRTIRMLFGEQTAYNFTDTRRRFPNDQVNIWDVPPGEEPPPPFFDPLTEGDLTLTITNWGSNGQAVQLDFEIEIVGIMEGNWQTWQTMQGAFISLEDMHWMLGEFDRANRTRRGRDDVQNYETVRVRAGSIDDVADIEATINDMGFAGTFSMEQQRQSMQEGARQTQMVLGFIGGIALFISALSIMNTMIMSVYERTREIGVMKVLGCALGNIRSVFLIEAALIGLLGGVVGNALSVLVSFLLNNYGSGILGGGSLMMDVGPTQISIIPPWLILLGLTFATGVGLISGVVPAMRAVKISALEAIRTE